MSNERARVKALKQKLAEVQDTLYDLMSEFADTYYSVEIHLQIESRHYTIDELRLFKEETLDES